MKGKWLRKFHRSTFGEYFDAADVKPVTSNKYDIVIICTNNGRGLRPVDLCLPHQVYRDKIKKLFDADPSITDITLVPAKSDDYIGLWERPS